MATSADTSAEPSAIRVPLTRSVSDIVDGTTQRAGAGDGACASPLSTPLPFNLAFAMSAPSPARAITEPSRTELRHAHRELRDNVTVIEEGADADADTINVIDDSEPASPVANTGTMIAALQHENLSLRQEVAALQSTVRSQRDQLREAQSTTSREVMQLREERDRLQLLLSAYSHSPSDTARLLSSMQDELASLRSEKHDWHRQLAAIDSESHRKERAMLAEQESLEARLSREQDEVDRLHFEQSRLTDELSLTLAHLAEVKTELLAANDQAAALKARLSDSHRAYDTLLHSWRTHDQSVGDVHWRAKSVLYKELFHIAKLTKANESEWRRQCIDVAGSQLLTDYVSRVEAKFRELAEKLSYRDQQIQSLRTINAKLTKIIEDEARSRAR